MTKSVKKNMPFQEALDALEAVVEKIESGDQPLETALEDFEKGVALARHCRSSLAHIEQKVQVLLDSGELATFDPESAQGAGSTGD
ncbi:MAG: exodeoxyribonuclease VII small subunit [Pseudomonadota bacterium]